MMLKLSLIFLKSITNAATIIALPMILQIMHAAEKIVQASEKGEGSHETLRQILFLFSA